MVSLGHDILTPPPMPPDNSGPAAGETRIRLDSYEQDLLVGMYVDRARMNYMPLSLLNIDIDGTKVTNDELGHGTGTRLINAVHDLADVVPHSLRTFHDPRWPERPLDVVTALPSEASDLDLVVPGLEVPKPVTVRTGGDEFEVLLPGADAEGASTVADRISEAVQKKLAEPGNEELVKRNVDIAVGFATLEPGMTATDLREAADQSMYANKIKQVPDISRVKQAKLAMIGKLSEEIGIPLRLVPKYIEKYGPDALEEALEEWLGSQADL